MQVRCPNCHGPIEVLEDAALADISCASCGSSFSLLGDTITHNWTQSRTLGHFELSEKLGMGAFGTVWKATDTELDRVVAVKVPRAEQLDPREVEQFLREARAAAQLRHPNIVSIHEVGKDDDTIYIVSDFVQGANLKEYVSAGPLSVVESVKLCSKIASAVHHAHEAGVIHRDLKPTNVMVDVDGEPYIMDFGLAKREAGEVTMTMEGRILGTPAYMSPEQARGDAHNATCCSDVYSIGVILYELLTGELPFRGDTRMLILQILRDEPPSPRKINPKISRDLETIVLKCLAKEPHRRYDTAYALADDLQRWANGEPIKARPLGRAERLLRWARRNRAAAAFVIGMPIFITAIVLSTVMYSLMSEADKQRVFADKQRAIAENAAIEAKRQEEIAKTERAEALRQEEIAKTQKEKAVRQEQIATAEREKAVEQETIAQMEREEALRQEGLATNAKNMAEYEAYVALIGSVAAKIDENAFGSARELLVSCKPELRNWEWGRLMHLCNQSDRDYDVGARVDAIAFAPDGKHFITGGWNGTARVWRVEDGRSIALPHEGLYVQAVAFSPIANQVATGCDDKSAFLRIWDLGTQQPLRFLQGHTDAITSISYSKDGKRLLTTSFDNTARIWNVETGDQLQVLEGHSWWVWDAAFSPDESQVVTVSQDDTAIVWKLAEGTKSPAFTGHRGPVYSVAFSPDGEYIASSGYDKRVLLWKPKDLRPFDFNDLLAGKTDVAPNFDALDGHTAAVRSVQFSADGKFVLSAGHDNTVKVWSVEKASPLKTLRGHGSWVRACAFSPDGQWVLSGSYDNRARLWNVEGYEEVRVLRGRVLKGHQDAIMGVSFSRDGHKIATASRDRTAKSWNADTGAELKSYREGHSFLAFDSAFFSDDKRLVTSAVDNIATIWNVTSGVEILHLERTGRAAAVAVSHDDRWIATGSDLRTAKLWNAETGELVHVLAGHEYEVSAVAFSPDDRFMYSGDANGRGVLWNRETGEQLRRLLWHTSKVAAARFTPDGTRLLTASDDKNVCQWDVSQLASDPDSVVPIESLLLKHPSSVTSLDLSANGKRALTACTDGKLRIWDIVNAALVRTFGSASSPVTTAALSRDGRLAVGVHAHERVVRIWNVETGTALPSGDNADSDAFLDFNKLGGLLWSARFSNDGNSLLTVGGNEARLWDMRRDASGSNAREIMTFSPHAAVASANFSPDGRQIVTASWDNSARIWNAESGAAELKLFGGHSGYVNSAVFSPDGKFVLTASDDQTAKMWDATRGSVVRSFEGHVGRVRHAAFSADGSLVLTASEDKTARIWKTNTAELVRDLRGHEWAVLRAAFSADGRSIITGSDDSSARIWDAESGKMLRVLAGHFAPVTSVMFSPDGMRALTASEDFSAKLWDAATGKEILNLRGHSEGVTSATFSDDGRFALTGSRDGTAILWLTQSWRQPVQGE